MLLRPSPTVVGLALVKGFPAAAGQSTQSLYRSVRGQEASPRLRVVAFCALSASCLTVCRVCLPGVGGRQLFHVFSRVNSPYSLIIPQVEIDKNRQFLINLQNLAWGQVCWHSEIFEYGVWQFVRSCGRAAGISTGPLLYLRVYLRRCIGLSSIFDSGSGMLGILGSGSGIVG